LTTADRELLRTAKGRTTRPAKRSRARPWIESCLFFAMGNAFLGACNISVLVIIIVVVVGS
jgi:hypothetical protein